jgi:hypothetical protein
LKPIVASARGQALSIDSQEFHNDLIDTAVDFALTGLEPRTISARVSAETACLAAELVRLGLSGVDDSRPKIGEQRITVVV